MFTHERVQTRHILTTWLAASEPLNPSGPMRSTVGGIKCGSINKENVALPGKIGGDDRAKHPAHGQTRPVSIGAVDRACLSLRAGGIDPNRRKSTADVHLFWLPLCERRFQFVAGIVPTRAKVRMGL